ncbi:MAG: type IV toxin-antitoxin system AbiEi family antitoxin [Ginsengibacter sp.]
MDIIHKTISTQSAAVVKHFTGMKQPGFTLKEVNLLLDNSSTEAVKKLMRDMVNRGLLLRLKDGVYWIIPYEEDVENYFPNWHLVAKYLTGNASYYIGYYSALEIHSLITQPSLVEQIVVDKQIKPSILKIRDIKFQFIYHNKEHFFGAKKIWVDSFNKVSSSDLEKTFIDCLYKPDYGGGITEIAKALYKSKEKIDYEKLFDYCRKFNVQAVIKRLGLLLEILQIKNPIVDKLIHLKTESYTLLEPSYEKKGKLISRWSIQQNIETEDIISPLFT